MVESRRDRIESKLREALAPEVLEIENESGNHNVPKGSETHFKVVVVSRAFDGLTRVARQQLVYGALADELKSGLHALTIVSKSPGEWAKDASVPASPPCLGGETARTPRGTTR